jgi:hypothetical protein
MSSIKYKEYQLVWDEIDGWSVGSLNNSETYSDMHVIEYAAYEQLKKELNENRDQFLERCSKLDDIYIRLNSYVSVLQKENTDLKKEIELLVIGYSDKLLELYFNKIENLTTTLKDAKSALEIASDYMNDEGQDPTYLHSVISKIGDI